MPASSFSPTASTGWYALLGNPVAHSKSPVIHNTAFRAQGVDAVYLAMPVAEDAVGEAVAGLRALGAGGANVTVPHKRAVLPHLDALTDRARAVGAVNTIVREANDNGTARLRGDNTDVLGFLDPLAPHAEALSGAPMVIFGAGGAARAVAYALLTTYAPAALTLVARRPAQAEALASDLAAYDPDDALATASFANATSAVRSAHLAVNATPLGMEPHVDRTPWPDASDFSSDLIAYDLVYAPRETRFLREAQAQGARPIGGLAMLLGQAAAAYEQWTGLDFPETVVREILEES